MLENVQNSSLVKHRACTRTSVTQQQRARKSQPAGKTVQKSSVPLDISADVHAWLNHINARACWSCGTVPATSASHRASTSSTASFRGDCFSKCCKNSSLMATCKKRLHYIRTSQRTRQARRHTCSRPENILAPLSEPVWRSLISAMKSSRTWYSVARVQQKEARVALGSPFTSCVRKKTA